MEGNVSTTNGTSCCDVSAVPPTSSSVTRSSSISRFHYALLILALAVILVIFYNVVFFKCCPQQNIRRFRRAGRSSVGIVPSWHSIPSLIYRKEEVDAEESNNECAVCLVVFVDGEDVRQLPSCRHYFHTPCIDMWLFSHANCPLCRAPVARFGSSEREGLDRSVELEDVQQDSRGG